MTEADEGAAGQSEMVAGSGLRAFLDLAKTTALSFPLTVWSALADLMDIFP